MKKNLLTLLALAALSLGAAATTPGNEGVGSGGCGAGQRTNGCGGTGGAGGAGGTAAAVSASRAEAKARAAAIAAQRQQQQQAQQQTSRNANRNTVNAPVTVSVAVPQAADAAPKAAEVQKPGDVSVVSESNRYPASTAYAAPLTASNGTCMGSSSGGAQGAAFGVTIASTWTDASCDIRYDAEALRAAGLADAAVARLCQKPEIARAMEAAGTPCPNRQKRAEASPAMMPNVSEQTAQAQYQDPIIRARLGLPPLK